MMHLLAQKPDRQHLEQLVDDMDETAFRGTLQELTQQSRKLLESLIKLGGPATRRLP